MSWFRFIFSKTFIKQIIYMLIISFILIGGIYFWLLHYTHHDEALIVPDLYGLSVDEAENLLKENQMKLVVTDTLAYDPDLPKYGIREQNPEAKSQVKSGRKIYVKINAGSYRKVKIPKLRGITLRQAQATLHALGLKVGKVETRPYFAEVVLDILHGKDTLRQGDEIPLNSVIKIIVGSGEEEFQQDSLIQDTLSLPKSDQPIE